MYKKLEVVVNVYHNVDVDVEKVKNDVLNRIKNPIELAKYVNYWVHSSVCLGGKYNEEMNTIYNNICKRWKKKYTKEENVDVRYYFSEDDWNMTIEIYKIF